MTTKTKKKDTKISAKELERILKKRDEERNKETRDALWGVLGLLLILIIVGIIVRLIIFAITNFAIKK